MHSIHSYNGARSWLGRSFIALGLTALLGCSASAEPPSKAGEQIATFAGGCFWCAESDFEKVPGVSSVVSGYTGGSVAKPTYEQVSDGGTGHAESVEVHFDPAKVSYAQLVEYFWRHVDPTVKDQQFCDHGNQYRTAIFTHGPEQARIAKESMAKLEASKVLSGPVYTEIAKAGPFYEAEGYHQDYYKKNPLRYQYYRHACGRDDRVAEVWVKAPPLATSH